MGEPLYNLDDLTTEVLAAEVLAAGGRQARIYVTVVRGRGTVRTVHVTTSDDGTPIKYGPLVKMVVVSAQPPSAVLSKIWLRGYRRSMVNAQPHTASATYTADRP